MPRHCAWRSNTRQPGRLFGIWLLSWVAALSVAWAQPSSPAAGSRAAKTVPAVEMYRLAPGDSIRVTVYQSADLSLDARITEAGLISYPLLGSLRLGGLTVTEAEALISQGLKQGGYVRNAQVIVNVVQVRGNQVNVLGWVARPGRYPLEVAGMRLTEVLALVGGVQGEAASDVLVLIGMRDGQPVRYEIDLAKTFTPEGREQDIIIMPGDVIWVDRAPVAYLYGEVQRPGQMKLTRGMTVMQALATAGGISQRGTLRGMKITRRGSDGSLATIDANMEDVLRDADVLYIRESIF